MTTETIVPTTGPKSTSFIVTAVTWLTGVAGAIAAVAHGGKVAVPGLVTGGAAAAISTVVKLFHDAQIHKAAIETSVYQVAGDIPGGSQALADVEKWAEQQIAIAKTDAAAAVEAVRRDVTELTGKLEANSTIATAAQGLIDLLKPAAAVTPGTAEAQAPPAT